MQAFREIPEDAWTTEDFTFDVGMEPLYLFDSTEVMSELTELTPNGYLDFRLLPGSYAVSTALYEPTEDTAVLAHRFALMTSVDEDSMLSKEESHKTDAHPAV